MPISYLSFSSLFILFIFLFCAIKRVKKNIIPYKIKGKAYPVDGDGFRLKGYMIRLWGMDAPEMFQMEKKYAVGYLSKEHLIRLTKKGEVLCFPKYRDPYGRFVSECFNSEGRNLSLAMVEDGFAIDLPDFSKGLFSKAQKNAQKQKIGLWEKIDSLQNPSHWRKKSSQKKK